MIFYLAIFIGGGLGAVCRYGLSALALNYGWTQFPWGTLMANIASCIILGTLVFSYQDVLLKTPWLRGLLVIGFCGGFSTFSTFSLELMHLLKSNNYLMAGLYIFTSIAFCIILLLWLSKNSSAA